MGTSNLTLITCILLWIIKGVEESNKDGIYSYKPSEDDYFDQNIMWRIDLLLGKHFQTKNEYSRFYAIVE
jgi:hypothetical protein